MISQALAHRLYRSTTIQRWTDHLRPSDMTALGKHGHMMAVAWLIACTLEEDQGTAIDWAALIEAGVFELLRVCVVTDIKSNVFEAMLADPDASAHLRALVNNELSQELASLEGNIRKRMGTYFEGEATGGNGGVLEYRILRAASAYATWWEYRILKSFNKKLHDGSSIQEELARRLDEYRDLLYVLKEGTTGFMRERRDFLDLCGRLRFQDRWSQTPILPRRPVLDHEIMVAVVAYLVLDEANACIRRRRNAFFGALFHDFPEALTRDIISPLKRESIADVVKRFELDELDKEVRPLLSGAQWAEFEYFVVDEFDDKYWLPGEHSRIGKLADGEWNHDGSNAYDGRIVQACDHFAAFMEAYLSISYGTRSRDLNDAVIYLYKKLPEYKLVGADFEDVYEKCYREIEWSLRP